MAIGTLLRLMQEVLGCHFQAARRGHKVSLLAPKQSAIPTAFIFLSFLLNLTFVVNYQSLIMWNMYLSNNHI